MNGWPLLLLPLVLAACGGGSGHPSARPATGSGPTATSHIDKAARPSSTPARTCTSLELHGTAEWQIGAMPIGGVPGARRFAREMEGLVHVTNVSNAACSMPEVFRAQLVAADGRTLDLPSVMRSFEQAPYHRKSPLASDASAAAPIMWEASWCGPDPGTAPTLLLTLAPEGPPLRVHVDLVHGEFGHVPSCDRAIAASHLVFAPFRQT